jgi:ssDNA-binding Zn-finger/Zn-ribbon topoisomerase 1
VGSGRVVLQPGLTRAQLDMENTAIVDGRSPDANMYGCLPCPKCHSVYRAPYRRKDGLLVGTHVEGWQLTVECDDCGYKQLGTRREDYE